MPSSTISAAVLALGTMPANVYRRTAVIKTLRYIQSPKQLANTVFRSNCRRQREERGGCLVRTCPADLDCYTARFLPLFLVLCLFALLAWSTMADIPSSAAPPTTDGSSASPSPFIVQTSSPTRPRTNVGISTPLVQFDAESNGGPREVNQHPLAKPAFLSGLKYAGYLEPLDTSRNKIKQRFNHFLEKQNASASRSRGRSRRRS